MVEWHCSFKWVICYPFYRFNFKSHNSNLWNFLFFFIISFNLLNLQYLLLLCSFVKVNGSLSGLMCAYVLSNYIILWYVLLPCAASEKKDICREIMKLYISDFRSFSLSLIIMSMILCLHMRTLLFLWLLVTVLCLTCMYFFSFKITSLISYSVLSYCQKKIIL